ncbi:unnamed protein product [Brachionus calyciflorus]|uniref:Uncharacterized protein n=1 Tax=Brachionus calyciflorus TaxID=104777 RepID=A0A814AKZ3_9BILA|nr:unnamed protein product [Brachionus calyciflorus]
MTYKNHRSKSSNSLIVSISIFCIFLAIVVMSLIYYKIKIKQIMVKTSRSNLPKNSSNQRISASFNSHNSNSQIYMSNSSQISFKSLPNIPPPPLGFKDIRSNTNSKSCSDINSKNKLTNVLKSNYNNLHEKINKKLNSIQDFFQEYVYHSPKSSNQQITKNSIKISEPRLISSEAPNTPKKNKTDDIYTLPGKIKNSNNNNNQSDYYQINAKILSVLASNQNLLKKKTGVKDLNELIQISKSSVNQSFVDDDSIIDGKKLSQKRNSEKKLVREVVESSSSSESDEIVEEMNDLYDDDDEDPNDYVLPYYQRNYSGLNGTYTLYDIPEEENEDTQDNETSAAT